MKETLITFEIAKLAKEKGFNEPSTHIYTLGFGGIKEDKIIRKFGNYEDNDKLLQPVILSKGQLHIALAPTQSLLQKWLREKHKIHISIIAKMRLSKTVYYFDVNNLYNKNGFGNCNLYLETYEVAFSTTKYY